LRRRYWFQQQTPLEFRLSLHPGVTQ